MQTLAIKNINGDGAERPTMSNENWYSWQNLQTPILWIATVAAGLWLRGREIFRTGKRTEVEKRHTFQEEQASYDAKLTATRQEIAASQDRLLTTANEERAQMRERIAVLEITIKTFKEQYDKQVILNGELREKFEGVLSDNARLNEENKQLKRRLAGSIRKHGHDGNINVDHPKEGDSE